jgi:hypothetical protein
VPGSAWYYHSLEQAIRRPNFAVLAFFPSPPHQIIPVVRQNFYLSLDELVTGVTGTDLAPRTVRLNHQLRQDIKVMEEGTNPVLRIRMRSRLNGSLDPDSQSGSGSRMAKITHKKGKS